MPTKVAVTDPDGGVPLETIRRVMERVDRQMVDVTPEPAPLVKKYCELRSDMTSGFPVGFNTS